MKKVLATLALGSAMFIGATASASAGCSCTIKSNCTHAKGGYVFVKKYRKVAVTCYKQKRFQVPTTCVETTTCKRMTCYKTKTKMVKSRCYKVEPYMQKVWVDASGTIKK